MKKTKGLLILMVLASFGNLFAQSILTTSSKKEFKVVGLKDSIAQHKLVAILPFNTSIVYKVKSKNYDAASNKLEEQKLRVQMQEGLYTYLLDKADNYTVKFQNVSKTNLLLKKANLFDSLDLKSPEDLAKLLGVDAVIKSNYDYVKKKSEDADIAEAYLLGWGASKTATGALVMQIYAGNSGTLLYRFYKELGEDLYSNSNDIMERMMKKVAYFLPYKIK
jgi:hypothetical protein